MERFRLKNGDAKPLNISETVSLFTYDVLWAQKLHFLETLFSQKERKILEKTLAAVVSGKRGSVPLLEIRQELFSDYLTITEGLENLPQIGPFIIASNHYKKGEFRGMWQIPAIAEVLDTQGLPTPRFVIDSTKPSVNKIPDNNFAKNLNLKEIIKDHIEHVLYNLAVSNDFIPTETGGRQIVEALTNHGVLGVFPTATAEYELNRGIEGAGRFFRLASARYNAPTVPIGTWHNQTERTFRISIGKPIFANNGKSDQEIVDEVMLKIGVQLPEDMWGMYNGPLQDKETRLRLLSDIRR